MLRTVVCLIALSAATAQIAEAQRRAPPPPAPPVFPGPPVEFGVRGGFDFNENTGSAGTHVRIPFAAPIFLVPSGDVYFNDARTQWQLSGDVVFQPRELGGIYGGVGVAFINRDFDIPGERVTRAGFNVVAGLRGARLSGTNVRPFAEGRWTQVDDYHPFRLALGIDVPVSGR